MNIQHDMNGLADRLGLMAEKRAQATSTAINKALITTRKEAVAAGGPVAQELPGLRVGAIRKRAVLTKATRGMPAGAITFSASRLRLTNFNLSTMQTAYGTAVRIPARLAARILSIIDKQGETASSAELRRAFIQRSRKYGFVNVWARTTKKSYPIGLLAVPSLSEILRAKGLPAQFSKRARERFLEVFQREAAFRLQKG